MFTGRHNVAYVVSLVALMAASPALAVTVSGQVAATDERAPEPATNVRAAVAAAGGVQVSWDLSVSDFARQSPTGTDFTAGGSFANVNDVSAYTVWRATTSAAPVKIGTVTAGQTEFRDATPVGSLPTYSVIAEDGAGNQSLRAAAAPLSLGPPPIARFSFTRFDFGTVAIDGRPTRGPLFIFNDAQAVGGQAATRLAVTLSVTGAGFKVTPAEFSIAGGGTSPAITLEFSAAAVGNFNGTYNGRLTVRTNDPNKPSTVVPLVARITNGLQAPNIEVAPTSLRFSQRRLLNTTGTKTITLSNTGGLPLIGSFDLQGEGFSTAAATSIELAAAASRTIVVNFTPTTAGSYSGSVVFATNDPDEPTVTVGLTGGGVTEIVGTGTIPTRIYRATLTFDNTQGLDFADPSAVAAFVADLIADLAAHLQIDAARIRNVQITEGSIVASFTISKTAAAGAPTAAEALVQLQATVADTTTDPFPNLPAAQGIVDASEDVVLAPVNDGGEPVFGWFTRTEDLVGFNDFFAFADKFGLGSADADYDEGFDIFPVDAPDGNIGFDDFFLFADHFGTVIDNAQEIRDALE